MYELDELEKLIFYLETTSLEPHDDYTSEFTYKEQKILYKYITKLVNDKTKLQNNWNELKNRTQKKIEQLEHFNEQLKSSPYTPQIETLKLTLKDMQEMEQGKDE